jgi:hypothetical protein
LKEEVTLKEEGKMKKSSKFLIIALVSIVLLCSVVVIFSQPDIFHLEQKLIPPGEYVPTGPEKDPPLTSHEEAIKLTDEFLKEKLGNEFFETHVKIKGVDEWPYSPSTWIVLYNYTYNGYTVEFMIAVNIWYVPVGTSRIVANVSNFISEPQKILISEEDAKRIAQEYGLEPPYNMILSCEIEYHRICWRVVKKDFENVKVGELAGVIIDAETGIIMDASPKGI